MLQFWLFHADHATNDYLGTYEKMVNSGTVLSMEYIIFSSFTFSG